MRIASFGELGMFKLDMKGPRKLERGNISSNFQRGIYVGFDRNTSAHKFITLSEGGQIKTSRHIMRIPEPERWSRIEAEKITIMPWLNLHERSEARIEELDKVEAPEERKTERKK